MKFIHAGDIHLGNPFLGLDQQLPEHLKPIIQNATLTAFEKLIDSAIAENVDFVLFPGDLYNSSESGPQIQEMVSVQFERLHAAAIPVYLSFGNHDFEANKQKHLPWPENIHIFAQSIETKYLSLNSGEQIALTGFSYQTQRQKEQLIDNFPPKDIAADYHIGLYHGALGVDGEAYAPFSVNDMLVKNYDYWALGHIHVRQTLNDSPFIGYSGNLQGLNRKEVGPKGYYLVTSLNNKLIPEFKHVAAVIWENLTISEMVDEDDLVTQIVDYQTEKTTLFSVDITAKLNNTLIERVLSGLTLEKVRAKLPDNLWVVRLGLKKAPTAVLAEDNIDQKYWKSSLQSIFENFNVSDYLSNQAPVFVREYFMSEEGQAVLQEKMWQIMQARKARDE